MLMYVCMYVFCFMSMIHVFLFIYVCKLVSETTRQPSSSLKGFNNFVIQYSVYRVTGRRQKTLSETSLFVYRDYQVYTIILRILVICNSTIVIGN